MADKNTMDYEQLANLKGSDTLSTQLPGITIHRTEDEEEQELTVLSEYETLYNKNKKLIGWLKIDDTNIDYPVMQTSNNEYYLDHNYNQEYDKNGSLFLDAECDIVNRNTNLIIYGHHMSSGKMFGNLNKYSSEQYYKDHSTIQFDTIYEKGTYQVMYVFRSKIYNEDEITFKYYQFFDASSEQEFNSYMQEMAALALYDTGVTASYGDQLLTLSTCDYSEEDGRFVVVAKRIV
jgi:sortase B